MNAHVSNLENELKPTRNDELAEELTVANSVVTAAALGDFATHAMISVKSQKALVTFDGTDPAVGGAGIELASGGIYYWTKYKLACARFIRQSGSSATIRIEPMTA